MWALVGAITSLSQSKNAYDSCGGAAIDGSPSIFLRSGLILPILFSAMDNSLDPVRVATSGH